MIELAFFLGAIAWAIGMYIVLQIKAAGRVVDPALADHPADAPDPVVEQHRTAWSPAMAPDSKQAERFVADIEQWLRASTPVIRPASPPADDGGDPR